MKTHVSPPYSIFGTSFLSPWRLQVPFLLLFLIGFTCVTHAQTKEWDKAFGGRVTSVEDESISDYVPAENDWEAKEWYVGSSYLQVMVASPDGGYLLGGYSNSEKGKDKSEGRLSKYRELDYWLVKIDAQGKKVWDKTLSGNIKTMVAIPGGGYLLGGTLSVNSATSSSFGYELIKIDNNGNRLWSKTFCSNNFNTTNYPGLEALVATPEGGYLLSGLMYENKDGYAYLKNSSWLVKIDESGTKLWDKTLSQSYPLITIAANGSYLLANATQLVNISRNGTQLWQKEILLDFTLQKLISTPDGGYLLGGLFSNPHSERSQDYKLLKLDATGTKVWDNAYGGNSYEGRISTYFQSLALLATPDGGYLLGGTSRSDISGDKTEASRNKSSDFWVVKISGGGNVIWDKTFGGFADDAITDLLPTLNGGYLLGGYSESSNTGDKSEIRKSISDYWVVKMTATDKVNPSLTLTPVADAYVRNGSYAGTNYGTAPSLVVKGSTGSGYARRAYLKFSLGSISSVRSAKLRIYGSNVENTASVSTAVYGVSNDSWAENTITWNNAPAASATALSSVGVNNQARYYELDVTSFVQAQAAGDKTASFLLQDPANLNKNLAFNSKENAQNPPQLMIETTSPGQAMRLNSGGKAVSTSMGSFNADAYFSGATSITTSTAAIANTTDDVLYQSTRKAEVSGGSFAYAIPVTNGTYTVRLHFAELAFIAGGKRKFNVSAEGVSWLTGYDIFEAAGGAKKAVVTSKTITVADGKLNLNFVSVVDKASVAAIEIVPAAAAARLALNPAAEAKSNQPVSLYPNPASDKIKVKLTQKAQQVSTTITDLTGAKHGSNTHRQLDDTTLEIPVSRLQPAVYLLQLQTEHGRHTLKFIKQ